MINAVHYVSFFERLEGPIDDTFVGAVEGASDDLASQAAEPMLHSGEAKLDGVVIRGIRDVVDPAEAQLPHRLLTVRYTMDGKLVHEKADLGVTILCSQPGQILLELGHVDRLRELHEQLQALLS